MASEATRPRTGLAWATLSLLPPHSAADSHAGNGRPVIVMGPGGGEMRPFALRPLLGRTAKAVLDRERFDRPHDLRALLHLADIGGNEGRAQLAHWRNR